MFSNKENYTSENHSVTVFNLVIIVYTIQCVVTGYYRGSVLNIDVLYNCVHTLANLQWLMRVDVHCGILC